MNKSLIKKTKIVCTIGPASMSKRIIKSLHDNGMDFIRINLSHGDFKQYKQIMINSQEHDIPVMLDTQGPEIRTINELITFRKGDLITIGLTVKVFSKLKKGIRVKLNDGLDKGVIELVGKDFIKIKMMTTGFLKPNQSILFNGVKFNLPFLSLKDKEAINFAIKNNVDYIALSFTSNASEVIKLKSLLKGTGIKVISKIENAEGVNNFKQILRETDGVMVARGDLGVEIASEKVPIIQKELIKQCNEAGKPVIVATQMMESMIKNKTPTRAETSDVANAIIDGADAVMLSAETSIGEHPTLVVKEMTNICYNTEKYITQSKDFSDDSINDLITNHAFKIALRIKGELICLTRSGYTARMLSRFKPRKQIIALTPNKKVARQLMISYGVKPLYYPDLGRYGLTELTNVINYCLTKRLVKKGDSIVLVAGLITSNTTNTILVHKVK